ncbi:hypothetical protein D3C71_1709080 [compost metagenome]
MIVGRDRAQAVTDGEQSHQGDQQPAARHFRAKHGKNGSADHDAQRVGADHVARGGRVNAERLGKVGQQAHRGELGGSDSEAADGKREQHQGGPVLRGGGGRHVATKRKQRNVAMQQRHCKHPKLSFSCLCI